MGFLGVEWVYIWEYIEANTAHTMPVRGASVTIAPDGSFTLKGQIGSKPRSASVPVKVCKVTHKDGHAELLKLTRAYLDSPGAATLEALLAYMRMHDTQFAWYKKFQVDMSKGKCAGDLLLEYLQRKDKANLLKTEAGKFKIKKAIQKSIGDATYFDGCFADALHPDAADVDTGASGSAGDMQVEDLPVVAAGVDNGASGSAGDMHLEDLPVVAADVDVASGSAGEMPVEDLPVVAADVDGASAAGEMPVEDLPVVAVVAADVDGARGSTGHMPVEAADVDMNDDMLQVILQKNLRIEELEKQVEKQREQMQQMEQKHNQRIMDHVRANQMMFENMADKVILRDEQLDIFWQRLQECTCAGSGSNPE